MIAFNGFNTSSCVTKCILKVSLGMCHCCGPHRKMCISFTHLDFILNQGPPATAHVILTLHTEFKVSWVTSLAYEMLGQAVQNDEISGGSQSTCKQ